MFDTIKKKLGSIPSTFLLSIGSIEYDVEYSSYVHAQFVTWVINYILFIIIQQNKLEIIHEHNL